MAGRRSYGPKAFLTDWDETRTRRVLFSLLAVLVGLLSGMLLFSIGDQVLKYLFPPSPLVDMGSQLEVTDLMLEWVAWGAAALLTGYVSVRIAKQGWFTAVIAAAAIAIWALLRFAKGGQPLWMAGITLILCAILTCVGGWIANRINIRRGFSPNVLRAPRSLDEPVYTADADDWSDPDSYTPEPTYNTPQFTPEPVYEPEPEPVYEAPPAPQYIAPVYAEPAPPEPHYEPEPPRPLAPQSQASHFASQNFIPQNLTPHDAINQDTQATLMRPTE